jgi:enoyl-CoA hydratase/carnithine racemase/carbon monoxide dehydrogenase subunit G
MEMNGEIRLEASQEKVWAALNDPEVLKACIPGCDSLEKKSDTEFVAVVVVKVGPIKAKFSGSVKLENIVAPSSYSLIGEGQGGVAGFAKSNIEVLLVPESSGVTVLRYDVKANIGGKIAQLGARMIDSTARKMADQFFASFSEIISPAGNSADAGTPATVTQLATAAPTSASIPMSALASIANNDIQVSLIEVTPEEEGAADRSEPQPADNTIGGKLARIFSGSGKAADGSAKTESASKTSKAGGSANPTYKVAVVTLNRPSRRNAMSLAMWRDAAQIFNQLGQNPDVRAVILTGAGGNFCAGADISEFAEVRATVEQGTEYELSVDACCDAIAATPKPTIAVVNGFCIGGGCHLAMACDFRFAAPTATFGIPAARLSIVYGVGGTQKLLALVGLSNAKKILYSAKQFGADEALRIGLADRMDADPLAAAKGFAGVMAQNAPLTIAGTKVVLNGLAMGMGALDKAVGDQVIDRAVNSEDYRDARQAFVEKRRPVFKGV